jgi:transcriptional regulator with XRE-family HTH domain
MNIQQRRLDKGWSQEELARHSGLSTRTIQRIESGQRAGLESLKCLAAVFETSISALMQEQMMNEQEPAEQPNHPPKQPMINKIERDAIEFAQSLLAEPTKGEADSLSKIEREAISYAKNLLKMFGK